MEKYGTFCHLKRFALTVSLVLLMTALGSGTVLVERRTREITFGTSVRQAGSVLDAKTIPIFSSSAAPTFFAKWAIYAPAPWGAGLAFAMRLAKILDILPSDEKTFKIFTKSP